MVDKPDAQYCANVLLKVCYRSRGLPYTLVDGFAALADKDVVIMGADVSHHGGGSELGRPSVAAVVGSIDKNFMNFPGEMRLIGGRREVNPLMLSVVKQSF